MKNAQGLSRYAIMFAALTLLVLVSTTPALAGSNGQQLSINACNADYITIQGYNQNGEWQTKSFEKSISKCGPFEVTGWWWKGNVDVIAYYYVTAEYAYYPGQSVSIKVPVSQTNSDFVSVNIPAPTARQWAQWRAFTWIKDAVPYDNSRKRDGYRQDCSGYVSFAWSLSKSYTGDDWKSFARQISFNDLQSADALDNPEPGDKGHMILFIGWVDKKAGTFVGYEENGYYGFTRKSTYTLDSATGIIKEGNYQYPGTYIAITKK